MDAYEGVHHMVGGSTWDPLVDSEVNKCVVPLGEATWRPCSHPLHHIKQNFERERAICSFPLSLFISILKLLCNFFIITFVILTADPVGEDGGGRPTAVAAPSPLVTNNPNPKNPNTNPTCFLLLYPNPALVFSNSPSNGRIGTKRKRKT